VAFAKAVAVRARPVRRTRAKAYLFALATLGTYAHSIGVDLTAEILLGPSFIERCCLTARFAPATARTIRSNLRAVRRAIGLAPVPPPIARTRAKTPYSDGEIAGYLALADAQPTERRRRRASALVALGAGAGIIAGELRRVRGSDVCVVAGSVVVAVTGSRPRIVPVRSGFCDRLVDDAAYFGDKPMVAGHNPDSHNVTNPILRTLSGGRDLDRLVPGRLRSTWLVASAEAIGIDAFMAAAGISCSQRLGDLVAAMGTPSREHIVEVFGRSR
jgi:integrase